MTATPDPVLYRSLLYRAVRSCTSCTMVLFFGVGTIRPDGDVLRLIEKREIFIQTRNVIRAGEA